MHWKAPFGGLPFTEHSRSSCPLRCGAGFKLTARVALARNLLEGFMLSLIEKYTALALPIGALLLLLAYCVDEARKV